MLVDRTALSIHAGNWLNFAERLSEVKLGMFARWHTTDAASTIRLLGKMHGWLENHELGMFARFARKMLGWVEMHELGCLKERRGRRHPNNGCFEVATVGIQRADALLMTPICSRAAWEPG